MKEKQLKGFRVGGVQWVLEEERNEAHTADSRMPCGGP